MHQTLPKIALVGRPNVGKSTLFNLLSKKRKSMVHAEPGVTRDRLLADIPGDYPFTLIDTGGLYDGDDRLMSDIQGQTEKALEEADLLLWLVDAKAGVLVDDHRIADRLRRVSKPVWMVVNKADTEGLKAEAPAFYELGCEKLYPISAAQRLGVDELIADACAYLKSVIPYSEEITREAGIHPDADSVPLFPAEAGIQDDETPDLVWDDKEPEDLRIKLAVLGKPNAGKSSLLNAWLGEERHLVSDVAGTTMDSVESRLTYGDQEFVFLDSAGIRRKRSISQDLEKKSVSTSLSALDECDIAILVLDAVEGLTEQDMRLAAFAQEKGKASVIVVNKWDLARENEILAKSFEEDLRHRLAFFAYAPVVFCSAKTGRNVTSVLEKCLTVFENYRRHVNTSALNRFFERAIQIHVPPMVGNTRLKMYFARQVRARPPTFVVRCNRPKDVHFSYARYLQNAFRKAWDYEGVPLRLFFRGRDEDKKTSKK